MGIQVSINDISPGSVVHNGDRIVLELFGHKYEHFVAGSDLEGFDIEIKPRYTSVANGQAMEWANSWGSPHGEPWVPGEKNETCPDCKGKGVIELFNSTVPCKCRGG